MKKIDSKFKFRRFRALFDTMIGVFTVLFSGMYFNKVYSARSDLIFRSPEAMINLTAKQIWTANTQNFIGITLISLGWVFFFRGMKKYKDLLSDIDDINKE